jgi:hypothetical protein
MNSNPKPPPLDPAPGPLRARHAAGPGSQVVALAAPGPAARADRMRLAGGGWPEAVLDAVERRIAGLALSLAAYSPASSSALPPAAAVFTVTVCSAQKRYR